MNRKRNTKHCVICGSEFATPPSSKKVTCSKSCQIERARRANTGLPRRWSAEKKTNLSRLGQTDNLKKGTVAAQKSTIAGPFETHRNALIWVIRSPEGVTYTVRNLSLWIREHIDFLPGTVAQARSGLMQIKRCMEGKTKRQVSSWKGWTLVRWEVPDE